MVDTPTDNITSYGTLPPIRNIGFMFKPPYDLKGNITQELFYAERVPNDLWHSIPIGRYEGIYGQFAWEVFTQAKDLHPDIIEIGITKFHRVEEIPVTTEQLAEGWLVTLRWTIDAVVTLEPEDGLPDVPITQVDIELWTNKLSDPTFTDRVLDTQVSVGLGLTD